MWGSEANPLHPSRLLRAPSAPSPRPTPNATTPPPAVIQVDRQQMAVPTSLTYLEHSMFAVGVKFFLAGAELLGQLRH